MSNNKQTPLGLIKQRWQALKPFPRQVLVNFGMALTVLLLIQVFSHIGPVQQQRNLGLDFLSRLVAGTSLAPKPSQPVFLIDIDRETYVAWQEPWLTPADHLAELINRLLPAAPAVLVVDFDLSRRDDLSAIDRVLADYAQQPDRDTHIIFMRTLSLADPGGDRALRSFRKSALETRVLADPYLHWASPLFIPGSDGIVRRWRLASAGCDEGILTILPSVQLLTEWLRLNPAARDWRALVAEESADCSQQPAYVDHLRLGNDRQVTFHDDGLNQRILYPFPPGNGSGHQPIDWRGMQVPALNELSALSLLNSSQPLDRTVTGGSVMIIGASHTDSGDIHQTPLGRMPGSRILANSIASLQGVQQMQAPPLAAVMAAQFAVLLAMSWIFIALAPKFAALVSTLFIVLIIGPASLLAYTHGLWLDFAVPLLVVQVYGLISMLLFSYRRFRDRGFRLTGRQGGKR